MAAVSRAFLVRLLSLLLVSTAAVAVLKPDLKTAVYNGCLQAAKEMEVCQELLLAHPECDTAGVSTAAELALQVTAKIARESDKSARSILQTMAGPSPCLIYCVRDVCAAAQKIAWVPEVLTADDWTRVDASLQREVTWTCGKSCPNKLDASEQAATDKFTKLKQALCVSKDLVLARDLVPK